MPSRRITENIGSHARDHLANERTFLAWLRTALAFIGLGVLVAKLVDDETTTRVGGLLLIGLGAAMPIYGVVRYERLAGMLDQGHYQSARVGPAVLGGVGLLVVAVAVVLVLV